MAEDRMTWAIVVHGGAKEIAPDQEQANRRGCLDAVTAGRAILERGGTAVQAVEAAIRVLESDPTFNAGYGSDLNADGEIEMDAAVMDGTTLNIGAVAAIRGVRHPVTVARSMLDEPPILLVGEGAHRFAIEKAAELSAPADLIPQRPRDPDGRGHDTVGCVAVDALGTIATGTSTGGIDGTQPGRVGDSPLPGCGFYADSRVGAVAFSGDGESIARTLLAARVIQVIDGGAEPQAAIEVSLSHLARVGGEAGGIAVDRRGRIGWAHNSSHFAVAWITEGMDAPCVRLHRRED